MYYYNVLALLSTITVFGQTQHLTEYAAGHDNYEYSDYSFSYGVSDPKSGDHKHHWEKRENGHVRGEYGLADADGMLRVVRYTAGPHEGFKAIVHRRPIIPQFTHGQPLYDAQSEGLYQGEENQKVLVVAKPDENGSRRYVRYAENYQRPTNRRRISTNKNSNTTSSLSKTNIKRRRNDEFEGIFNFNQNDDQFKFLEHSQGLQYLQPNVLQHFNIPHTHTVPIPNFVPQGQQLQNYQITPTRFTQNIGHFEPQKLKEYENQQNDQRQYSLPLNNGQQSGNLNAQNLQNTPRIVSQPHTNIQTTFDNYQQNNEEYNFGNSEPPIEIPNYNNLKVPLQNISPSTYQEQIPFNPNINNYPEFNYQQENIGNPIQTPPIIQQNNDNAYTNPPNQNLRYEQQSDLRNIKETLDSQKHYPLIFVDLLAKLGLPFYPTKQDVHTPFTNGEEYNYEDIPSADFNNTNQKEQTVAVDRRIDQSNNENLDTNKIVQVKEYDYKTKRFVLRQYNLQPGSINKIQIYGDEYNTKTGRLKEHNVRDTVNYERLAQYSAPEERSFDLDNIQIIVPEYDHKTGKTNKQIYDRQPGSIDKIQVYGQEYDAKVGRPFQNAIQQFIHNLPIGYTRETIWQAGDGTADPEIEVITRQLNATCAYFRFNETTDGTEDGTRYNIWNVGDYSAQRQEEELIRSVNITCENFTTDAFNNFTSGYSLGDYCSQCMTNDSNNEDVNNNGLQQQNVGIENYNTQQNDFVVAANQYSGNNFEENPTKFVFHQDDFNNFGNFGDKRSNGEIAGLFTRDSVVRSTEKRRQ